MKIAPIFLFQLLLFIGWNTESVAQIPKIGNDTLLEIATWNIEWFGDPSNGPTNETLQFSNVKEVLLKTEIDIWGFCEISNQTVFQQLIAALPGYSATLATYSQTQKTGLMWKSDKFDLLLSHHILSETTYDYDFAGRPPLEVLLVRKDSILPDTLFLYVLHLKAFGDQTSYTRRKNAASHLKAFLDLNRSGNKVIVLGDWNDNILGSIYSGTTESPFLNFVNDSLRYFYLSKQLVDEGKKSYTSSNGTMIDHIMKNSMLDSFYLKGNAKVLDMLPTYISSYSSTTSDHYPVMGYFNFKRYLKSPVVTGLNNLIESEKVLQVYPNPATQLIQLNSTKLIEQVCLVNLVGTSFGCYHSSTLDIHELESGCYLLVVTFNDGSTEKIRLIKSD